MKDEEKRKWEKTYGWEVSGGTRESETTFRLVNCS